MTWRWPNFSEAELACRHCGKSEMDPAFMDQLQALRLAYGKPMPVTSGYRCPAYNEQVSSTGWRGPHTTGKAVDIGVTGAEAYTLLALAMKAGFTGVGIAQKGPHAGRFLHLDTLTQARPAVWSY